MLTLVSSMSSEIHTIGHSTRSLEEFIELLQAFAITLLVDVRTVPGSRRNPQFNKQALGAALTAQQIRYVHLPELGGLRRPRPDSPNSAWQNQSFRGYADYMQTAGFEAGLAKLSALTGNGNVALMCAEAVPWRCHRSLLADALRARGVSVQHITSKTRATPHRMTPFAHVEGAKVTYPAQAATG